MAAAPRGRGRGGGVPAPGGRGRGRGVPAALLPTLVSRDADSAARGRAVQEQLFAEARAAVGDARWAARNADFCDGVLRKLRVLREGVLSSTAADGGAAAAEFAAEVYEFALTAARHCGNWDEAHRCETPLLEVVYPALQRSGGGPLAQQQQQQWRRRRTHTVVGRALRLVVQSSDAAARHNVVDLLLQLQTDGGGVAGDDDPLLAEALPVLGDVLGRRSALVLWRVEHGCCSADLAQLLAPFVDVLRQRAAGELAAVFMQLPVSAARAFLGDDALALLRAAAPAATVAADDTIVFRQRPA